MSCIIHLKPLGATRRLKAQKISLTFCKFSQPVLAPLVCTFIIPFSKQKTSSKSHTSDVSRKAPVLGNLTYFDALHNRSASSYT